MEIHFALQVIRPGKRGAQSNITKWNSFQWNSFLPTTLRFAACFGRNDLLHNVGSGRSLRLMNLLVCPFKNNKHLLKNSFFLINLKSIIHRRVPAAGIGVVAC